MEGKLAEKRPLEAEENPQNTCKRNNSDAPDMSEELSFKNTLGSILTLSLQASEEPSQMQEHPLTQLGLLQNKLDEARKENQNLRAMLNQITKHYTDLQNYQILVMKQQQQLASSPSHHAQKVSGQNDKKKAVLASRHCVEDQISSKFGAKYKEDEASGASCRKARVSIRARSDVALIEDGCQWRKYGQKTSKGNPCPRAYFRCSIGSACPVRKQVQRCFSNENVLLTTYEGDHNHPLPAAARAMATATSAALKMFLSGSTASTNANTLSSSASSLGLFSSLSPYSLSTNFATFSPSSSSCPTITLDLDLPSNNINNDDYLLQFQRAASSVNIPTKSFSFPLLQDCSQQSEGLCSYLSSNNGKLSRQEKSISLVDKLGAAMAQDPSFMAALAAAISSFNGDSAQN